ncbi:hypothetical protein BCIN_10g04420 [Botrytis cinerea B05.10]|uniref:Myb-like domain-containing protein n=2 Tax=Botryotinia fuckeliana TaxID=40559 RepID=A0A384JV05_BOTFB|nr:hypothetical protein BCIN_10g04420 [Botrytis cinerea B05.10]ATZ54439.1 hypothetical protein BCIN_10g04420 [Botrytis cinerea B05.10]
MMFTKPTEFSFANMDEDSAKKALSVIASFFYIQDGGVEWLNDNLSQFGCTADGLVNEALVDPELTQHQVCQDLHHAYRLHINPDDEDAAAYAMPASTTGGKGKSAHPFNKPFAYAAIHPQVLVEQAFNVRLARIDEVPVEEQSLGEVTELEASHQEFSVTDQLVNQFEYESSVADYSEYQSEPEDLARDVSDIVDDDDSDDEDYVEKSVTNFDELTYEQQLALTIEASLKENAPQKHNGESSGINNQFTPPASQQKETAPASCSGGKTVLSPAHSSSGKHILPASPHTTPCPSSLNQKREHDDDESLDNKDYTKSILRPIKRLKKSVTKSSVHTPVSSSTSVTTAPSSSSSAAASAPPPSPSSRKASSKLRKSGPTNQPRRSAWTDDETFKLYKCLVKRREVEAKLPDLVKLYDAPLWNHISEELASVHGIHRAPGGCKSNWNRNGREFYDFDERSLLKRSKSLATSVQVPKKNRKGKKPASVEDIDDDE